MTMWAAAKGYLLLALVLIAIAVAGGIYAKGRLDATHKAAIEQLNADIQSLKDAAEKERLAREADTAQAMEDRIALDALEASNKELLDDLQDASRICLDPRDADRLRNAARGLPGAAAAPAKR